MVERSLVVLGCLLGLASCGSGGGAGGGDGGGGGGGAVVPGTASCAQTQTVNSGGQTLTMKICTEWTGVSAQQMEAYRLGCGAGSTVDAGGSASQQRVFGQTPCSHEGALGGCRFTVAGVSQTGWYYDDDSGFTLASIQMLCARGGTTFVAP